MTGKDNNAEIFRGGMMFNKIADTVNKLKTGGKGSVIVIIIAIALMVTPPLIWTVTQISGQFCEQDAITRDGPVLETQDQVAVIGGDICDTGCCECSGGKCTW